MKKIKFNSDKIFYVITTIIALFWVAIVLYPLIYIVSSSFSSGNAIISGKVILWPVELSVSSYEYVFQYDRIWVAYANTILYTIVGSLFTTLMTIMAAYPLSRKTFSGRRAIMTLFTVTMFFGGGLIPTYIQMSNMGLVNTRWIMFIAGIKNVSYIIIMKTFFKVSIPDDLLEAAKIDGISDLNYLFKIVLPLSKPVISVILLYSIVAHWNSYMTPLIYLMDRDLQPLQIVLKEILISSQIQPQDISSSEAVAEIQTFSESIKYSLVVVSTVPMLILYPIVQKFFVKGMMMGSLKE